MTLTFKHLPAQQWWHQSVQTVLHTKKSYHRQCSRRWKRNLCSVWPWPLNAYRPNNGDINLSRLYHIYTVVSIADVEQVMAALYDLDLHVLHKLQENRLFKMTKYPERGFIRTALYMTHVGPVISVIYRNFLWSPLLYECVQIKWYMYFTYNFFTGIKWSRYFENQEWPRV